MDKNNYLKGCLYFKQPFFIFNNMKHIEIILLIFIIFFISCRKKMDVDILIINGSVYNGIDTNATNVSIGIKGDKIVFLGNVKELIINATKTIDANGMIVSPGFIDPHTHADGDLIDPEKSHNLPFLMQGVTTIIVGNDGDSFFPISKYNKLYNDQGIGTNVVQLIGHGTIRKEVIGYSDKKVSKEDINEMLFLVQQEMEAGAYGISTGLFYAPGSYSSTNEIIALAKKVALYDGIYDTHLRDEGSFNIGIIPAIKEAIEIGRQTKIPIHISHIKCLGIDVWNQSDTIMRLIEKSKAEGIDITANQYPYEASATSLKAAVVPRWAESGGIDSLFVRFNQYNLKNRILDETNNNINRRGGPEKLLIVKADDTSLVGKNLLEISEILTVSPEEAVFKALETGFIKVASFNMNVDDIVNFMKQDWVVTGSDGGSGHPRKYGSFPRKYRKFVVDEKIINLATFINNSSAKTGKIFKIQNRGKLIEGYFADVIIFDPKTFKDMADYKNPFELAEGLVYSIINGKISVEKGVYTGRLNGKVLLKK